MTVEDFIAKWERVTTKERTAAQTHFNDLCEVLGLEKPLDADPDGTFYTFERHVTKTTGGKGFADVWKRGSFAWEYKGKTGDLRSAYVQLLLYRDDLENPPLLVVCDLQRFEVHTNFTGTPKQVHAFTLADLRRPEIRQLLVNVFTDPERLNPKYHRENVTQEASRQIGGLAQRLQARGHEPQAVAHFLMQLVFAFFAEDVRLLPDKLVTQILSGTRANPERARRYLSDLFGAMAKGGEVLLKDVPYFNGGLFDDREALPLEPEDLTLLQGAAELDWAAVEPVIFGTLFERSLDPQKRAQLGAHYTSREDILRLVEPVILAPLRAKWQGVRQEIDTFLTTDAAPVTERTARTRRDRQVNEPLLGFLNELHSLRVLDPACGSGNFLYVAMQQLKELEKEVVAFAQSVGAPGFQLIGPKQFLGLEVNVFAHELASVVVWIGYLQWNHLNGLSNRQTPILERLDTIRLQDALLDDEGETVWPEADYIVGNPPFLGNYKLRRELGDEYVETLYRIYGDRVPNGVDFVCYWFEKARAQIEAGKTLRAGLISTSSIRQPKNIPVLRRIKETGGIFTAWADEPWILEGAAVRVSLVAFDDGSQEIKTLDGVPVAIINSDLTGTIYDISSAPLLRENAGRCFQGVAPAGPFDIPEEVARAWMKYENPNGASNVDVLKRYIGAQEIVKIRPVRWLIDFNQMPLSEAEEYLVPFAHVVENVRPEREKNREKVRREFWWRHGRSRPEMRVALKDKERYVVTPRVSKHPVYVWLTPEDLPSSALSVIATDSDFDYGILNSRQHLYWRERRQSTLEDRPQYTNEVYESFPFPVAGDRQREEVEKWARYLDASRSRYLQGDGTRSLTMAYSDLEALRETRDSTNPVYPLLLAHEKLDAAVATAYGWAWPMTVDEILAALFALNLERVNP